MCTSWHVHVPQLIPNPSNKPPPNEETDFPIIKWSESAPIPVLLAGYPWVHQTSNHSGHEDISWPYPKSILWDLIRSEISVRIGISAQQLQLFLGQEISAQGSQAEAWESFYCSNHWICISSHICLKGLLTTVHIQRALPWCLWAYLGFDYCPVSLNNLFTITNEPAVA